MKKLLAATLFFIGLVWSTPARATLFTYDLSVVMLAEYLAWPLIFGDVTVGVSFPQQTSLDYPYNSFQLGIVPREMAPAFIINGYREGVGPYWSLSQVSLTDYRIWVGWPAGNIYMDLLYDQVQAVNAPFREPDQLLVNFGAELRALPGVCNTATTGPCPIGTGGTHTFEQGDFSFARDHVDVPEPSSMLLAGVGFVGVAVVIRRRGRK
jgi:hypothetical protein